MSLNQTIQKIHQHQPKHTELLKLLWRDIKGNQHAFDELIKNINTNPKTKDTLSQNICKVFHHKDLTYALVESGISSRVGFTSEIIRKIKHSILPEQKNNAAFHQTLTGIFKQQQPTEIQLSSLFDALQIEVDFNEHYLKNELIDAIEVLSYRITATAIESEFIQKFKHNQTLQSFIKQNKEIHGLIAQYTLGIEFNPHLVTHIKQLLQISLDDIQTLRKTAHHQGVSLQLTYTLHRLSQQIERLQLLFCLLYTSPSPRDRQKSRMPSSA